MTRKRSTWSNPAEGRTAATRRNADIFTMNQEHPQPSATEYENGSPDSWAETPTENKSVEKEYEGGRVKRNELGLGEFRDDTWAHKDSDAWNDGKKYDNMRAAAERRAMACERIARSMLRGASQDMVEATASELMSLPDQFIVASLKRLDTLSPETLPQSQRFQRALACTKLSARTLGDSASESQVERLASLYNGLDDVTLRAMLKVAAEARIAEAQGQDEEEGEDETTASAPADLAPEQQSAAAKQDACGMTADELASLDAMLGEAGCAPAAPAAPAPAPAPMMDDLTNLFTAPAATPAISPAVPAMPIAASDGPDIEFDDSEEEAAGASAVTASAPEGLEDLFNDLPDVQGQRELRQASIEQAQREGGYGSPSASARTASTHARKLGAVRAAGATSSDDVLGSLWDAPR